MDTDLEFTFFHETYAPTPTPATQDTTHPSFIDPSIDRSLAKATRFSCVAVEPFGFEDTKNEDLDD